MIENKEIKYPRVNIYIDSSKIFYGLKYLNLLNMLIFISTILKSATAATHKSLCTTLIQPQMPRRELLTLRAF